MTDEQNIAPEGLSDEQLLNYLKGALPEADNHAVEKQMMDSDFVNDGVEGLQSVADTSRLNQYVEQLNKNLHRQLARKKRRKDKRKIKGFEWVLLAAAIVLAICLAAWFIIRMMK
jgi:anti-sigma factor RsiW